MEEQTGQATDSETDDFIIPYYKWAFPYDCVLRWILSNCGKITHITH
jgi:hypothetical protein